ncbi:hypothetical protein RND71_002367 [Anisodus tanguticus]|uniref:Uncharacterized protein n=1 Tax=Anisodus tanguticus TaxID=243964 RepID=A0AAE1T1R8_9SOLA|nr:hypothetical protein RND71_002367 [Anisodus tanguticus]
MERKVEIISQELIKPIVPQTCESYNLSVLDQLAPQTHIVYLLYYPHDQDSTNLSTRSLQLKNSLSKILVNFYPFAGRLINDNTSIRCNSNDDDIVVVFIEAFAHTTNSKTFSGHILGCSVSHKLADAASVCAFVRCWAKATMLASGNVSPAL